MPANTQNLERAIRGWLLFVIISLIISGLTAFALETELNWLLGNWPLRKGGELYSWIRKTYIAIRDTNRAYPFVAYGYDWLAFAHLVIAVAFIGPLRDPVRNSWFIWDDSLCRCISPGLYCWRHPGDSLLPAADRLLLWGDRVDSSDHRLQKNTPAGGYKKSASLCINR